ncbi:hypothetical protein HK100_001713 [Physocladia obscura]|uniref:Uncharacterized protein n=1 Tax=Physocladia obscura TaxID=109957 RepID=A0AAD5TDD7_9FUNG|nr:hypothetical protein HK100_001713 [Physocladia obscura]
MSYVVARVLQHEMYVRRIMSLYVLDEMTRAHRKITPTEAFMYLAQVEAVLIALGLFAFMAGVIVFVFTLYNLYLVSSGQTANESFKWEDLEYELKNGFVTEISVNVLQYNRNYGIAIENYLGSPKDEQKCSDIIEKKDDSVVSSTNIAGISNKKRRKKTETTLNNNSNSNVANSINFEDLKESDMVPFTTIKQVRNIYDRGVFLNIWDVFFPTKF